jgi:hypothetical protein
MFNIIALISIFSSLMSPVDVKPNYYQEYNLVGEIPDIAVSVQQTTANSGDITSSIIMPEIAVTANRPASKADPIDLPYIVVTAPRITPTNNMKGIVMMPEIVVSARRSLSGNVDIVQQRPGFEFDYGKSIVKEFSIYAMIAVIGALAFRNQF